MEREQGKLQVGERKIRNSEGKKSTKLLREMEGEQKRGQHQMALRRKESKPQNSSLIG